MRYHIVKNKDLENLSGYCERCEKVVELVYYNRAYSCKQRVEETLKNKKKNDLKSYYKKTNKPKRQFHYLTEIDDHTADCYVCGPKVNITRYGGKSYCDYMLERVRSQTKEARKRARTPRANQRGMKVECYDTKYQELFDEQEGKCAICNKPGKLVMDHDHSTGEVRALLCTQHNMALGLFKDNCNDLIAAAEYLKRYI